MFTSRIQAVLRGHSLRTAAAAAALVPVLSGFGVALAANVDPSSVTGNLDPGGVMIVNKTVHTPAIPPNPDIVFLVDTTTSMGPAIASVQANLPTILSSVTGSQPTAQFAVAQYKDIADEPGIAAFSVLQNLTANQAAVTSGINNLTPLSGGGTDAPEDYLNALHFVATGSINFRPNNVPIVLLIGDASSHANTNGHDIASVLNELNAADIKVIAIDVGPTPGQISDGLNAAGQATLLAAGTGGQLFTGINPSTLTATILAGLNNLPVTVSHQVSSCNPNLSVSLSPAGKTVTSGQDATFTETITVSGSAPQATTLTCHVDFLLNGSPAAGFSESISITVNDVTPPTIVGSRTPGANGFGWNNTTVTVHFECADAESGIASCTADTPLTTEGAGQSVTGEAVDNSGNTAFTAVTNINIDLTDPTISGSRTPGANGFGWNNSAVTVHFVCGDALSGVQSCSPDTTLSGEGANQSVTGTAKDKADNTATATVSNINIDLTNPTISGAPTTSPNGNGWYNTPVTVHFSCGDALSGVATCTPDTTLSSDGANQSVSGTAVDKADNTLSTTVTGINIDSTPPTASCDQGVNPGGKVPSAGNNPNSGQNPDGFYKLNASDGTSGVASVVVADTGSSFVAGPFPAGANIKLTQAPGATPSVSPGSGAVAFDIKLKGDGILRVTDLAGNVTEKACNVAPKPK